MAYEHWLQDFPRDANIADRYDPLGEMQDPEEIHAWFDKCVRFFMEQGRTRTHASQLAKDDIAYFAGYFPHSKRMLIEETLDIQHPFLGRAKDGQKSVGEIMELGMSIGSKLVEKMQKEHSNESDDLQISDSCWQNSSGDAN